MTPTPIADPTGAPAGAECHWFVPSGGDGRHLLNTVVRSAPSSTKGARSPTPGYLAQVARVAEHAGFDGVMLPTGPGTLDPWLLAAALCRDTRRLRLIVTFRPGLELPTHLAQRAATLQTLSDDRLALHVVHGSLAAEQRAYGDFLDHDARYERSHEFLALARAAWQGEPIQRAGRHYLVDTQGLPAACATAPPISIGGASDAAERLALAQGDLLALWGETPPMLEQRVRRLRAREAAGERGRPQPLRFALRIHVIARPTEAEAWAEAARLLRALPPSLIEMAQRQLARSESVGQARMRSLHRGKAVAEVRELEVHPNVWSGVGLVRGGAGTAIVGSYAQVAERIEEYAAVGVSSFLFSGYPNLEEARVVGEHVLPRLRRNALAA